ncbi:MAG: Gfo/Idh/MocA family oxidoreductase [Deltaproteobacteria bacterium]|nr:Gfo/Idh/MocA family oxidoreductase [Deltaproteobacteria bacterium]
MKVAVIGARRQNNGIGAYISRFFHEEGARVVSVMGTTRDTAIAAAAGLKQFGIQARAYTDISEMIGHEAPDAVVIASPVGLHHEYVLKCIDAGIHIFCEKPFVWLENTDLADELAAIFFKAEQKGLIIAMNSQWPFSLPWYEELCGKLGGQKIDRFFMRLSPQCNGPEMIVDSVPHALSLLYHVLGQVEIRDVDVDSPSEEMAIRFKYGTMCDAHISLVRQQQQPRSFAYGFNGRVVSRQIALRDYRISFTSGNRHVEITDPLKLSVRDFISAWQNNKKPLINNDHIIWTTMLLRQIYNECIA